MVEQRFAHYFPGVATNKYLSIVLTKTEHEVFTKAWRREIGYLTDGAAEYVTDNVSKTIVTRAAKTIYKDYPEILTLLGL